MKLSQIRNLNALSAAITKPHRYTYTRNYPTTLINPDGSCYAIRYNEPRKIITLPLNIWTLSESDRKARLEMRKPKSRIIYEDDLDDSYDASKYLKFVEKKKSDDC